MDPFAAIGLAGNVLEFVNFTCKLITDSRELYTSAGDLTRNNDVLDTVAKNLSILSANVSDASFGGASVVGAELSGLATQCKYAADEILNILSQLKASGSPGRWKIFAQAVQEVRRKDFLYNLGTQMDKLQRQLNTYLLVSLSNQQAQVFKALRSLEDDNRRMGANRLAVVQQLRTEVMEALETLIPESQLDSQTVRDVLASFRDETTTAHREDIDRLSGRMDNLASKLSQFAAEGLQAASDQAMLKTLSFTSMRARHSQIHSADLNTFGWILGGDSVKRAYEDPKFADWLRSGSGFYWIVGKAGSGKSTLMKWISSHDTVKEALRRWAGSQRLVTASYFFWNAGTKLQKSQEGLLRSLLFEILRQCPRLIATVCQGSHTAHLPNMQDLWSRSDLLECFDQLNRQAAIPAQFCFFIDGLDEYDGDHFELTKVLEGLTAASNIKICASSRPWSVFADAFGQDTNPKLVVEKYTTEDIRVYTYQRFNANVRFQKLSEEKQYRDLVQEIVDKSQGVFLWVCLAVRSLLKGFTGADPISLLRDRLAELPPDLETFFRAMFNQIEQVYRKQTAQIFLVALTAISLSFMTLYFLDEEDPNFALSRPIKPMTEAEVDACADDIRRRLDGRCKGLLEICEDVSVWGPFFDTHVVFMHRSVRDFLLTNEMQQLLQERSGVEFDPRTHLCKAGLARLKSVPMTGEILSFPDEGQFEYMINDMALYAYEIEQTEEQSTCSALLDEAERVLVQHPAQWKWRRKKNAFLGFAIRFGLRLYVMQRLAEHPTLTESKQRPLLDYALTNSGAMYSELVQDWRMVEFLLQKGATPNRKYRGTTVWHRFLEQIYNGTLENRQGNVFEIIDQLLAHGASVDELVAIPTSRVARPKVMSVREIVAQRLGSDLADELFARAPPSKENARISLSGWIRRATSALTYKPGS